ncbi:MAG: hypothetical protein Kow00109_10060 [Acidobacteriota bacterium]
MEKTTWFHIGLPKTGSSALQRFLTINEEALRAHGVLYPRSGRLYHCHTLLARELVGAPCPPVPAQLRRFAPVEGQDQASFWDCLAAEIAGASCPDVVVSSEAFYSCPHRFRTAVVGVAGRWNVRIIVYLRPQDTFLESLYGQAMKWAPYTSLSIAQFAQQHWVQDRLDYHANLELMAKTLGPEAIVVRIYDRRRLRGNIFRDFLSILGIAPSSRLVFPSEIVNPSPSPRAIAVLRRLNELELPPAERACLVERLIAKLGPAKPMAEKGLLSGTFRRDLLAKYEASNAELARRLLGRKDGRLFPKDLEPEAPPLRTAARETPSPAEIDAIIQEIRQECHDGIFPPVASRAFPVCRPSYLDLLRRQSRPVVIWGASQAGGRVLYHLLNGGIEPAWFVDSDSGKVGKRIFRWEVRSPEELNHRSRRKPWVVIGSMWAWEIAERLESWGYRPEEDYFINDV